MPNPGPNENALQMLDEHTLRRLAEHRWPPAPDQAAFIDRDVFTAALESELTSALIDPNNLIRLNELGEDPLLSLIRPLEWDSRLLLMSCARLDLFTPSSGALPQAIKSLVRGATDDAQEKGVEHLTTRISSSDTQLLHALLEHKFVVADCLLMFGARPDHQLPTHGSTQQTRIVIDNDIQSIKAIARGAFRHDRFHSDRGIPGSRADGLYEAWAENSCKGEVSDRVLVAESAGSVAGFVALSRTGGESKAAVDPVFGSIDLIAVAEGLRGRGFGESLISGAAEWFREQGVVLAQVGTQSANVHAVRLYEKAGFRLSSSHYTLVRRF